MATYVYRSKSSSGARVLAEALGACRYRGTTVPIERKVKRGDIIICWGEQLDPIDGVKILNGATITNKLTDALRLKEKGVPTIEVSKTRPLPGAVAPVIDPAVALIEKAQTLAEAFGEVTLPTPIPHGRDTLLARGVTELVAALAAVNVALHGPAPVATPVVNAEWLPRMSNHVGGNDLLTPPTTPDFFSKKEVLTNEYRIHSFKGKSIRAGKKGLRAGFIVAAGANRGPNGAHPWIRSWDGGWRILYDGVSSKQKHRDLAHKAVEALGLDFGAVDIGEKADGTLIVLEVNRAPGLEAGTIDVYSNAITQWIEGGGQ